MSQKPIVIIPPPYPRKKHILREPFCTAFSGRMKLFPFEAYMVAAHLNADFVDASVLGIPAGMI